jgi:hypothetical protein
VIERTETCVFCGCGPTTKQHIFRKAKLRALLPEQSYAPHLSNIAGIIERRGKSMFGAEVEVVCGPCNSQWINELEDAVQGALAAMILGEAVFLTEADCALLATWACMTTMVRMFQDPPEERLFVPSQHYELYRHRRPPKGWRVWIGSSDEPYTMMPMTQFSAGRTVTRAVTGVVDDFDVVFHQFTCVLGHFVFVVVGAATATETELVPQDFADTLAELLDAAVDEQEIALSSIWPNGKAQKWSPSTSLSTERILALSQLSRTLALQT